MISDPAAQTLALTTNRCSKLADLFEGARAKAVEMEKEVLSGGKVVVDDGLPGFGIDYPWSRLRFVWAPVADDSTTWGKVMVLKHGYDAELKSQWRLVDYFFFNINGSVKLAADGAIAGDFSTPYYLLMDMLNKHMTDSAVTAVT